MGMPYARAALSRRHLGAAITFAVAVWCGAPAAQRIGYPPEEFAARRERLAKTLQRGTLVMSGASSAVPGLRFRQDHDFFYLTGNESLNATLVMDAATGESHLFLPRLSAADVRYEGGNWLQEKDAARARHFSSIQQLDALQGFLARRRDAGGPRTLWTRLSEPDTVNAGRDDVAHDLSRRRMNPLLQFPTENALRVASLRERFPQHDVQDVTPHLDRLRLHKTPKEIEILRHNGRISAEAMGRAIEVTSPGRFEYELEAEATHWLFKHGMQAVAYPAIVGSGPMGNQWHYEDNGRQMKAGEMVVMDYGGSLDYLTVDITRTWPVSGRFTDAQRRAYLTVLEAQKALIASIRPGVTRQAVRTIAEDVFRSRGYDPRYAYLGHYVGLSVHDVGDWSLPFEAGMVMAIEPILDEPENQMHVRVEDTILVTPNGAEILTGAVPKEVDELLGLMAPAQ
jgi:Xaa-Pro aminopeptidase